MKILSIFGTRPEAIKMAPVLAQINSTENLESIVCVTGQHRQMLDQVLALFDIEPDFDLNVMTANQSLAGLTAKLLSGIDATIVSTHPDWVVAQGDTTTAFAAALCAFYRGVPFGHVEAGLRTGDLKHPFPEEANRRMADIVASLHFAPTRHAANALLSEGYGPETVLVTGNTVIDALLRVAAQDYDWSTGPLRSIQPLPNIVLITAHRRESFGEPFRDICDAIARLAREFFHDHVHFVYPVHLNPNVREPVNELLSDIPNVHLLEPLPYFDFVHLIARSTLILTDSGGIQEEAPTFRVPVLVMRETTERPEGVDAGLVRLIGTNSGDIVKLVGDTLRMRLAGEYWTNAPNPYGDGKAAARIVNAITAQGSR